MTADCIKTEEIKKAFLKVVILTYIGAGILGLGAVILYYKEFRLLGYGQGALGVLLGLGGVFVHCDLNLNRRYRSGMDVEKKLKKAKKRFWQTITCGYTIAGMLLLFAAIFWFGKDMLEMPRYHAGLMAYVCGGIGVLFVAYTGLLHQGIKKKCKL